MRLVNLFSLAPLESNMLLQYKSQPPAKPQVLIFAWRKRLGEFGWDLRLGRFRITLRRKVSVYPDLALRRALRLYTRRTVGNVCVFLMTFGTQTGRIGRRGRRKILFFAVGKLPCSTSGVTFLGEEATRKRSSLGI